MSRCWSMLNNHRGRDSRPAASHGHVPNPTGPDVDTPSGGGEVPESARSRTDRPGRSAGAREALRAIPNTKRPARTRQKKTTKTTGHRNGGERRRTQEAPAEEAAHRGLNSCQSFLGRTLIQGLYICEDSQTTASRSATTGGCPPMLKLFMIGNQNQNSVESYRRRLSGWCRRDRSMIGGLSLSCGWEVMVGVSWALNHTGGTISVYGRTSAPGPVPPSQRKRSCS